MQNNSMLRDGCYLAARRVWRLVPNSLRERVWLAAGSQLRRLHDLNALARPAAQRPVDPDAPLVVAGLFRTANGIGEAARCTYRALVAAGLSPLAVDLSDQLAPVDMRPDIPLSQMPAARSGTLIMQLNAPETAPALHHLGMRRGRSWYTIGYWAWELATFPRGWESAFAFLSELWTVSDFSKEALLRREQGLDIAVFGHAVVPPAGVAADRARFDLPNEAFVFLAMADSMSSLERKNPFAAIAAHRRAFGDDPSRILLVKTRNLDRDPAARARLTRAVGAAANIRLMDAALPDDARWALLASADALISLHRAEGFGLTLAEAMAIGKPVIATRWSGNMAFTNDDNAFLVNAALAPCRDPFGVYTDAEAYWADPDLADAAEQMLRVAGDAPERARRAAIARATMARRASLAAVGNAMALRLMQARADA